MYKDWVKITIAYYYYGYGISLYLQYDGICMLVLNPCVHPDVNITYIRMYTLLTSGCTQAKQTLI